RVCGRRDEVVQLRLRIRKRFCSRLLIDVCLFSANGNNESVNAVPSVNVILCVEEDDLSEERQLTVPTSRRDGSLKQIVQQQLPGWFGILKASFDAFDPLFQASRIVVTDL